MLFCATEKRLQTPNEVMVVIEMKPSRSAIYTLLVILSAAKSKFLRVN